MARLPVLRVGSVGPAVERMQAQLFHWGLLEDADEIDGIFGDRTRRALLEFQGKRQGEASYAGQALAEDGECGMTDWAELLKIPIDQIQVAPADKVTAAQASAVYGRALSAEQLADLNECLYTFQITQNDYIRHFLAQTAHESGGLRYLVELYGGWRYEGRTDLGNTQPGDGPRFRGAGAIQLTGRSNYRRFADYIGDVRVVEEGAAYVAYKYPFSSAGFWWTDNRINDAIDGGANCRRVSRLVNGKDPANGLQDRLNYYAKALAVIK